MNEKEETKQREELYERGLGRNACIMADDTKGAQPSMMKRRFGTRNGGRATGAGAGKSGEGVCIGKGSIGQCERLGLSFHPPPPPFFRLLAHVDRLGLHPDVLDPRARFQDVKVSEGSASDSKPTRKENQSSKPKEPSRGTNSTNPRDKPTRPTQGIDPRD